MSRTNFDQLLEAGCHFGHLRRKWNPAMAPYIFMERNGIHIIDLHKTVAKIDEAADALKQIAKSGKKILFVATKKQAKEIVAEKATSVNMPYVIERWPGGMLTNFKTMRTRIDRLNQLKAMTTTLYVNERPAYGRNKVHLPHVASFCATGNNLQFLTDDTGDRRWLPFEVEDIDSPWEADLPYEGIYSQTYALYQDVNFRYWFTDKEIQQLRGHVQQFEVPRPEYELILTYYRKPVGLERGVYTTSSQIIGRFGNTSLRLSLQKVGRAMRELGFRQVKASNANYWVVVERTTEEVQHLLPAEAEQADPPGEKPSEENTELPF